MNQHTPSFHQRLFVLLLVLLPTQLGLHFWPEWSTLLGRRIDYFSPTVYFTDIVVAAILLLWFTEKESWRKQYESWKKQRTIIPLLIPVSVFVFANIFFATNRFIAMYDWMKFVEFVLLGWYVVNTKPPFHFVALGLSIAVAYSSILAIAQFILQHSVGGWLWWIGERTFSVSTPGIARMTACITSVFSCQLVLRPYATFPHPNVLGGFLAVTLPIIYVALCDKRLEYMGMTTLKKRIGWTVFVLGSIGLCITMSRSAVLVGAAAIIVLMGNRMRREYARRKSKSNVHMFIRSPLLKRAAVLTSITVIAVLGILVLRRFIPNDESIDIRTHLNAAALAEWMTSPIIGVGLGNFLTHLPDIYVLRPVSFLQPVHNIYLLILSETGLVGGVTFLVLVVLTIKGYVVRIMDEKDPDNAGFHTYLMSFVGLLLLGLVDHYPLTLQQGQLLFTIIFSLSYSHRVSS